MAYCQECGSQVNQDAKFCADCGASISSDASEVLPPEGAEVEASSDNEDGFDIIRGLTAGGLGILIAAVVAFAFTNIGGSGFLFVVTVVGVSYYLYDRKHSARSALGSGLYILALWILASPIMFYIPVVGGADTETAEGAGAAIGGALGIVIWGFAGLIIAVIVAAIGFFVNRGVDSQDGISA